MSTIKQIICLVVLYFYVYDALYYITKLSSNTKIIVNQIQLTLSYYK